MLISPDALVLVAVTPTPTDLEIARVLGWYRIPLRRAPKVLSVDYLAFYQTGAFGEQHRWRVEFVAEVRGHELTTRKDLFKNETNHPRANEEYYKLALGNLQTLPTQIVAAKWKRLTFLYSTGQRLMEAQTLNELVVHAEERQVLWRSLRERALRSGKYKSHDLPELALDPQLLALLGGLVIR